MADVQKTTLYLDAADYRRVKALARSRGCTAATVVREAVAEYTARHAARRPPASLGAFTSGRHDLSERAEALLAGMGRRR